MRFLKYAWHVLMGLVYLAVVIGILSVASTRFETLVLAGMVELYAAVLYNFSLIGVVTDVNNHAAFVRFKVLADAQGLTGNEDGTLEEQLNALAAYIKNYGPKVWIGRLFNAAVSIYALFKIIQAIFFT